MNYAEKNWKSLTNQLQGNGHRLINPRNRAQMIDDALNLAFAGYLNYDIALNLTLYLPNEREYVPWKAALTNFHFLHNMFARSGHFDKFKVITNKNKNKTTQFFRCGRYMCYHC